ncbi:MAG: DegT/DnrJ/EryC1/StrS family aminotransferase [Alphaproteobacteria bacterium]|nr:DegT/DnrJ/EryC1/StrS family aminotransferase [Alphaproteobacteria bacterium]
MTMPRFMIPDLPSADELLPYLRRIDTARWYTNFGPLVCEFEEKLQAYLSVKDPFPQAGPIALTTLASCHQALVIGMRLLRLRPGATVLVPCVTFPSSAFAIEEAGATPLFADIDPVSWTLTPAIARAIASRRKIDAVMPVAVYGVPVEGWDTFSRETGIPVLIDAAAALEAQPVPERCIVAYSMHATKPFGIGEGGILAARDPAFILAARQMSNFSTQNRIAMDCGTNAKLSEYHGAVALAQFARWQGIKQRRRRVLDFYIAALEDHGLASGLQKDVTRAVTSSLMLKLDRPEAQHLIDALDAQGIPAHRSYWPPLPHHPHFANVEKADALPHAEALNNAIIGLPFHGFMREEEVEQIVGLVAEERAALPRQQKTG